MKEKKISHRDTEVAEKGREEINRITEKIIGCAIQVHRQLGAGLLGSIYESALCVEFALAGLQFERQVAVPMSYKGRILGDHRLDFRAEDVVIVELKSVERLEPLFEAQVLTYLKISRNKVALLINFNSRLLTSGIQRFIL